jgi:hypothetical protein
MSQESRDQPTVIAALASERSWSPGRDEAWWWLAVPLLAGVSLLVIYAVAPEFYKERILPEGYGVLELSHFFMPLTGFIICLGLLRLRIVRAGGLLLWAVILFALVCFYIAGEEHSWGQHFVHWNTPEYWAEINRQDETNLHNISPWFNNRPRLVLEIGIVVGGLLMPLWQFLRGPFRHLLLALFTPPAALIPTALMYLVFKAVDHVTKRGLVGDILARPSEAIETFMYLFILFYLIVFARRVRSLEAADVKGVALF